MVLQKKEIFGYSKSSPFKGKIKSLLEKALKVEVEKHSFDDIIKVEVYIIDFIRIRVCFTEDRVYKTQKITVADIVTVSVYSLLGDVVELSLDDINDKSVLCYRITPR